MSGKIFRDKLARLRRGHAPRVLDLFAGCGGISLGFQAAGFRIDAAVELDPIAARTHALNFHGHEEPEVFARHAQSRDITTTEPDEVTSYLGLGDPELAFDVLVGGPPCQAYARVGRAKLREVADHPSAYKIDPRGNLYLRYLHYIRATKPLALLIENVPDSLNYGGHNVMGEIAEVLESLGYRARYSLINSAFHGIPQMRDRVYLLAVHQTVGSDFYFPRAIRHMVLPSGYSGTRSVALRLVDLFGSETFEQADHGTPDLPGPVTCSEALGDLAPITLHLEGKGKKAAQRFDVPTGYPRHLPVSAYAKIMRTWQGFEAPEDGVRDHVIRFLPRDSSIFRAMPNGGEYPAAHQTAVRLYEERIRDLEQHGGRRLTASEKTAIFQAMVPPYPVGSFPNRWWKLKSDFPARTLMAHIGKDTYSHIHHDSAQARVISVREAARLQSFPDGFAFSGTMNPAYRQIGNAVPPLMAKRLAETIMAVLQRVKSRAPLQPVPVAAE